MTGTVLLSPEKIKRGDIIGLPQQIGKLGLVYAVMRAGDRVESFKILPIHIYTAEYSRKNDNNNLMIPNAIKTAFRLRRDAQYRVEFALEDIQASDDLFLRYAKTAVTHFGAGALDRMERKIIDERKTSYNPEPGQHVFVFRKDDPTHVKLGRQASKAEHADISLSDAAAAGLISEGIFNVLSSNYPSKQGQVTTLREVYKLATSKNPNDKHKLCAILNGDLMKGTTSLQTAFNYGEAIGSKPYKQLRELCGSASKNFGEDQFLTQLHTSGKEEIISGWIEFMRRKTSEPSMLAGFQCMYPA